MYIVIEFFILGLMYLNALGARTSNSLLLDLEIFSSISVFKFQLSYLELSYF